MNLHIDNIDKEKFEQLNKKIIEIFKQHEINLPYIKIEFSDEETPFYRPIGAEFKYNGMCAKNSVPFIQLAIPVETEEEYLYPMIAYQLSHEYTHAYIHRYVLLGSSNIINELLAEVISYLCLIELGFDGYELKTRQGQDVSLHNIYGYITKRKDSIYKKYSNVYGKNGCYLGLISSRVDVWRLVKKFKTIINEKNSVCECDLQFIYENGFFNDFK